MHEWIIHALYRSSFSMKKKQNVHRFHFPINIFIDQSTHVLKKDMYFEKKMYMYTNVQKFFRSFIVLF